LDVGLHAVCVVDDLRAQMWTSAFEPTVFLAGFGNLPVQGRFYRNFQLIVMSLLFCRAGRVEGDPEHLGDPDRLRAPTRLYATTVGINHLSSL
jgi:hypothetical protein